MLYAETAPKDSGTRTNPHKRSVREENIRSQQRLAYGVSFIEVLMFDTVSFLKKSRIKREKLCFSSLIFVIISHFRHNVKRKSAFFAFL